MSDKELLELAAKAAGRDGYYCERKLGDQVLSFGIAGKYINGADVLWNPLDSKADCLQMEIDLEFMIQKEIFPDCSEYGLWFVFYRGTEISRHPDRQRASTMAAAAIGRGM